MGESAPLSSAVFHILLALADGPLHGYGVMKRVEEDAGLELGPGTIYGSIQRLTQAGWVQVAPRADDAAGDARRGKRFELTEDGEGALRTEAIRIRRLAGHAVVERLATDGAT